LFKLPYFFLAFNGSAPNTIVLVISDVIILQRYIPNPSEQYRPSSVFGGLVLPCGKEDDSPKSARKNQVGLPIFFEHRQQQRKAPADFIPSCNCVIPNLIAGPRW
jgi:hypothetical protein